MRIIDLPHLWYENDKGEVFVPDVKLCGEDVPKGFKYQHSEFPSILTHTVVWHDEEGKQQIARGETGWSESLALALANSGKHSLSKAIMTAAHACERCMNALAHEYGLDWGYPEYSEQWQKSGTRCKFCDNG